MFIGIGNTHTNKEGGRMEVNEHARIGPDLDLRTKQVYWLVGTEGICISTVFVFCFVVLESLVFFLFVSGSRTVGILIA